MEFCEMSCIKYTCTQVELMIIIASNINTAYFSCPLMIIGQSTLPPLVTHPAPVGLSCSCTNSHSNLGRADELKYCVGVVKEWNDVQP